MGIDTSQRGIIPWWFPVAAFFAVVAIVLAVQIALGAIAIATGAEDALLALITPPGLTIQVIFMALLLTGTSVGALSLFEAPLGRHLGLSSCAPGVYAASAVGVAGVGLLVDEAMFLLHSLSPTAFDASGLNRFNAIFADAPVAWFVVITAAVTLGPALGEEIFFRGFALRVFRNHLSAGASVILSAALFGALHFDRLQGPGAALIGLYLGFVALVSRSLWPAVLSHGVNNLLCALFARFGGSASRQVWEAGHPPWVLVPAAAVVAVSAIILIKLGTRDASGSRPLGQ